MQHTILVNSSRRFHCRRRRPVAAECAGSSGSGGRVCGEKRVFLVVARHEIVLVLERVDERVARVEHAGDRDQHTKENDEHVDGDLRPGELLALQVQVKVARPDEREHGARDAADEAHENGKVRYENGQEERENDECNAQADGPHLQVAVRVIARAHEARLGAAEDIAATITCRQRRRVASERRKTGGGRLAAPILADLGRLLGLVWHEKRRFEQLDRGEVRQRIGEQRLDHQYHVDEQLEVARRQVVGDHFVGVVLPGEKGHVAKGGLEQRRNEMCPVEHRVELGAIDHAALHGGHEDLRRVAEDDDAQRDGKRPDVDLELNLAEVPRVHARQAVDHYDGIDDEMHDGVAQAETRDELQAAYERARHHEHARDDRPRRVIEVGFREAADEQIAAQHQIENARHEQLDVLRHVDEVGAHAVTPHVLGYVHVGLANAQASLAHRDEHAACAHVAELVVTLVVQTVDENLARVAAHVGDEEHGEQGPVAAVCYRERKTHHEHALFVLTYYRMLIFLML